MIQEVRPGEKISAKTQNEIIQAANGLMRPAGKFVNTPNGSLYPNPTPQFNNMLGRCVETLFQLKFELKQHLSKRIADEDAQKLSAEYALSSVWYGYSMNLGNDFSQLKDQVKLMQPDNDDIFIVGGQGVNGGSDSEDGDRLSVHLVGSQMLIDGSDKEGFFDLGVYWKSPMEGCSEIEVQKMQLSTDNTQYGPTKNAFIVRGKNYPSQSVVKDFYQNKYGGQWEVVDATTTTVGYVYNQKLVQLRTGLLFPQTAQEWVDSEISAVGLSSIQERSLSDLNYHQFFNFDQNSLSDFALSDQSDCDLVIRDYKRDRVPRGSCVNYVKVSDFLSATRYDVDTDATAGDQRSIEVVPHNQDHPRDYLQLYDFDNSMQNEFLQCSIAYGETSYVVRPGQSTWYPDSQIQFVCRDYTEQGVDGQIVYDGIRVYAPRPNAQDIDGLSNMISDIIIEIDPGHECSCDLSALSAAVDELSSELSNRWKCGGVYDDNCYGYSIGDSSQQMAIDLDNGGMWYGSGQTVDWHSCELYDLQGADGKGRICLNWADRQGYDSGGNVTLDWENGKLFQPSTGNGSVDWNNGVLYKPTTGAVSLNWKVGYATDPSGSGATINWNTGQLWADHNTRVMSWKLKKLIGGWSTENGGLTIGSGNTLTIGNTSLSEAQLQALLALLNTP